MEYGCGQCLPCRINRRRLWTARLMLESFLHESSYFLTLTYSEEYLPKGGTLVPRDVQLYLKRVRKLCRARKLRFYLVGEYGERLKRPHYHLLLFGVAPSSISLVAKKWEFGYVDVRSAGPELIQYITGYMTKGMTKVGSCGDRAPEFCRMSLRPGIGGYAIAELVRAYRKYGDRFWSENGDVAGEVRMNGKKWPLGRYLKGLFREELTGCRKMPEFANMKMQLQFKERMREPSEAEKRENLRKVSVYRARHLEKFYSLKRALG